MSFTETQKGTLQEILDIPALDLDIVLDRATITAEVETLIGNDITLWATYRNDFLLTNAGPSGFKGRLAAEDNRQAIRKRIANWLNFKLETSSGSRLVRS